MRKVYATLATTVLLFPWLITGVAVILILRKIVEIGAHIWNRKEFLSIVTSQSTVFSMMPVFSDESWTAIVILEVNRPTINLPRLIKDFENKVLHAKVDVSSSALLYPELKCKLVQWWGYYFWAFCPKFDITDHIKHLKESEFHNDLSNPDNWNNLINYVSSKRIWQMDKPIWELLVKEGVKTERGRGKSLLIWRSSHVLCDGWSIFKLTARLFDTPDNVGKEMIRQSGKFSWKGILTWCTLPYDFADYVTNVESDDTSVSPPNDSSHSQKEMFSKSSPTLNLSDLKRIKDEYGVDFLSLLFAGTTAAIRDSYLQNGIQIEGTHAKASFILPVPNHPPQLRNHMSHGAILLPVGEEDSKIRLQLIGQRMHKYRTSKIPALKMYLTHVLGSLPVACVQSFQKRLFAPIVVNNLVGPPVDLYLHGDRIDISYGGVNIAGNRTPNEPRFAYDTRFYTYAGAAIMAVTGFEEFFSRPDQQMTTFLNSYEAEWRKLLSMLDTRHGSSEARKNF
ncbi:uncharacterized protein LOC110841855 isoform X2 [Folsomia candida]|uniref:O-acyltransferase WSD1 C-terminal domain-containing protein n=1 Tax=Folsomia candida TaxID=158441 RepID=A0A226EY42_FOLCA|nr:uncharacterized protein LOC110841855 isoform X2 [Folsomia candida]OXA62087.1 hypothetical protein Fcan01_00657 [Folsomia candida]